MGWWEDFVAWLGTMYAGSPWIPSGVVAPGTGATFFDQLWATAAPWVGSLLAIAPLLPTIMLGMFAVALITSVERLDADPLLDFFWLLWDVGSTITSLVVSAIGAVLPI